MLSIGKLVTTPLLLRKPCKLFASVARVCQRQLGFLVLRHGVELFSLVAFPLIPRNMTLNGHFTFNFHYDELRFSDQVTYLPRAIYRIFLLYDVTNRDVRKRTVRTVIRGILRLRERIADRSQMKSCGTLTNEANISIQYYLVPDRLSTDSKTRDFEWPFCVKFCFAPLCLEL